VQPLLGSRPHAAALLGWGPRLLIFVEPRDVAGIRAASSP
jgi:hypothetical protein